MKQMMNISTGFLLGISTVSLLFGLMFFNFKSENENKIKHGDIVSEKINKESASDKIQRARRYQGYSTFMLIMAGGSGALAVGLAVAGKDKAQVKE
jgi:hypothetical protein